MNKIILTGRTTKDAEIGYLPGVAEKAGRAEDQAAESGRREEARAGTEGAEAERGADQEAAGGS